MRQTQEESLNNKTEHFDENFTSLAYENQKFENKRFENCKFSKCDFNNATFINCKFVDCDFASCNLASIDVSLSSFNDVSFEDCKLIGVNWTQAKWPQIKLASPLQFYRCNMSHSSFYALELREIIIEACKAHDVDFRDGDFSNGSFADTDLKESAFMHTHLKSVNFINAINYRINPNENTINKAKFSMPDAVNLLYGFDIEIEGLY